MGTVDEENRFYAIPISEEDFAATAAAIEGLTLRTFDLEEDVDTITVEAVLDFDSTGALSNLLSSSSPGSVEIERAGETTIYRQNIFGGATEEINAESRDFIETFFSGYTVEFSLEAPTAITAVNLGDYSGRVATVELPMTEVLLSPEEVTWEVQW
jgi:hypothetical protein